MPCLLRRSLVGAAGPRIAFLLSHGRAVRRGLLPHSPAVACLRRGRARPCPAAPALAPLPLAPPLPRPEPGPLPPPLLQVMPPSEMAARGKPGPGALGPYSVKTILKTSVKQLAKACHTTVEVRRRAPRRLPLVQDHEALRRGGPSVRSKHVT